MRVQRLIINADDFGENEPVNRAILESFARGFCSSASLMPNMLGFQEACQRIHENKLLDRVGLHLVFRDGYPLTERVKQFPRFCDGEGRLCLSRRNSFTPVLYLSRPEKEALAEEIRAQIKRCRDQGIPLTHVDSHYHLHNEWAIAEVLIPILKEQKVLTLRIARNFGKRMSIPKRAYKAFINGKIQKAGLDRTKYFGSLEDYLDLDNHLPPTETIESVEVMIHPKFSDDGRLVDAATQKPLETIRPGCR
ncbi:MAG: ChbG/HpnK family deacetylase [Candidatus Omnitrophica bacterium]|nr:ChbG/HpnK family deacetylase [Candidatus Omnitrophota bacterium]